MEIAILILDLLIFIGIFYVVFVQNNVTKIKDSLLDTLKDYPKAAEAFLELEKRKIEKEVEIKFTDEMQEILGEISVVKEKDKKKFERVIFETSKFIGKIFRVVEPNPLLERFIEEIEYDAVKYPIKRFYSDLQKEQKD